MQLLDALVAELPAHGHVRLRIGMTNPPFILEHLADVARVLRHPYVFSYLHIPVQCGSDAVLLASALPTSTIATGLLFFLY